MKNYINEYHSLKTFIKESIKTLRANIQFATLDEGIKTIVVTSTRPNEGKSLTSLLLGIAMAEAGKRTLIFEADCRRPSLGSMISKRPKSSWVKFLTSEEPLTQVVSVTQQENLYFIDSDPQVSNPVELMGSKKFGSMLDQLKNVFDIIIFDTPPLGSFIDAAVLASQANGTILVISAGQTDGKEVKEVVAQLKKANAKILGVVLNKVKKSKGDYQNYYYYNKRNLNSASENKSDETEKKDE